MVCVMLCLCFKVCCFLDAIQVYGFHHICGCCFVLLVQKWRWRSQVFQRCCWILRTNLILTKAMSTPLYQTATFKQVILEKFSQNFVSFSIQERGTWVLLIQEVKCCSGPCLCNLNFVYKVKTIGLNPI